MDTRLGRILARAQGNRSLAAFARDLGWSYSFIRGLEHGYRTASDEVLCDIAGKIRVDEGEVLLAAYCDRSPGLARALERRGLVAETPSSVGRTSQA